MRPQFGIHNFIWSSGGAGAIVGRLVAGWFDSVLPGFDQQPAQPEVPVVKQFRDILSKDLFG